MAVTINGTTGIAGVDGSASTPAVQGTDTNTGIFYPAADTIAFAEGGAEAMRIDSSGNVGIGTTSPTTRLHVSNGSNYANLRVGSAVLAGRDNNNDSYFYANSTTAEKYLVSEAASVLYQNNGNLVFMNAASGTAGNTITFTERARITSGGALLIGKTTTGLATAGFQMEQDAGCLLLTRSGSNPLAINRLANDGVLVDFYQDTAQEGTISVSGNTVSYNGFSGGHWSQLPEGRGHNPDIPRGTVMSTIGEMCEWKSVVWDEVIEHEATEDKEAWTETIPHREAYLGNLAVGATFEEDGFTKTIVYDGNERLPKVKVSDVVGDKAVYGVFQTWDEVQDMLVTSLGAFVVRIASGVTVQIGDLLESNGDGCAKVQDDDVIRSKTIAKVTSTTPTATYADGSYTVPAVIYCG